MLYLIHLPISPCSPSIPPWPMPSASSSSSSPLAPSSLSSFSLPSWSAVYNCIGKGGSMVSKSNYASPIFSWQESCRIAGTVLRCELSGETAWQVMILCFRQSDVSDVSKKCSFPCPFPFQRNSRWKSLLKGPFPETWIEVAIFHEGRWWQDFCNDSKFMLVKSREEVLKYLLLWRSSLRAKKKNLLQPRNPQTRP